MKKYTHAERANIVFRVVHGIDVLIEYTEEDSASSCMLTFDFFVDKLYNCPNTNPIRKKLKTREDFVKWFDRKFPLID